MRWHRPREEHKRSWEKQLNRLNFKITNSTVVCSNHFTAGYYNSDCPIPSLNMKGYDNEDDSNKKRKAPLQRKPQEKKAKPSRHVTRDGTDYLPLEIPIVTPSPYNDHCYEIPSSIGCCARCEPISVCKSCAEKSKTILTLLETIKKQQCKIDSLFKGKKPFSINDVKENDKLMTFYTGLQSYSVFEWLYNRLMDKVPGMTYASYKKESSGKKRGPKRQLSGEEEMFLTLVRIRLGLLEEDLVFRFGVKAPFRVLQGHGVLFLPKNCSPLYIGQHKKKTNDTFQNVLPSGPVQFQYWTVQKGALKNQVLLKHKLRHGHPTNPKHLEKVNFYNSWWFGFLYFKGLWWISFRPAYCGGLWNFKSCQCWRSSNG